MMGARVSFGLEDKEAADEEDALLEMEELDEDVGNDSGGNFFFVGATE